MNRYFSKEDTQMVNKHTKRCSILLVIREMQFKTTMRYHFIPTRMVIIKKSKDSKCWGETGKHACCWQKCKMVHIAGATANSTEVLQKIKNRYSLWTSNLISGYISERTEIRILKGYRIFTPMFRGAQFTIASVETSSMSIRT